MRGGALRVLNDGVAGKAAKLKKIVDKLGIIGWDWLKGKEGEANADDVPKEPDYLYDLVGGRPIISQPSKVGGLRLRYGRCRNTGLAAVGLHPATMAVLEGFTAIGTQLRIEKPGKSAVIMAVDSICGPIVKLKDGSVVEIRDEDEAQKLRRQIEEILFLGDVLVGFGEFLENNYNLLPSGYCEEIWAEEVIKALKEKGQEKLSEDIKSLGLELSKISPYLEDPLANKPSAEEAIKISKILGVPLHPKYSFFFEEVTSDEILYLRENLRKATLNIHGELVLELRSDAKKILEKLRCPHIVMDGTAIVLNKDYSLVLREILSIDKELKLDAQNLSATELIEKISGIKVKSKGGTFIGARMGRPEKAKPRLMKPPVHALFPVGLAGGPTRDLIKASERELIEVEVVTKRCQNCGALTYLNKCEKCGGETSEVYVCKICKKYYLEPTICCNIETKPYLKRLINLKEALTQAMKKAEVKVDSLKGVKGLISKNKTPEALEKGLLRAKYGIYVYKDGTTRFDVTNAPLTHFKPSEIKVSVQKLRELGYEKDHVGADLVSENQVVELKPQDIIIPVKCAEYLYKVAMFVDELLEKVYGVEPYYRLKSIHDLVGHLVIGIAPHTSAGVIGRIIGFTDSSVCYAHPYWHAAKRRNCDGDEDAVMLALDALLNFSKEYLPEKRGGLMDAPLVVTTFIDPLEVDEESHNVEVTEKYSLEFYQAAERYADPRECLKIVEVVKHRLGKPEQYQNFKFAHRISDLNKGPKTSSYSKLKTMLDKVNLQLTVAKRIAAVDVQSVVEGVLKHHFIPDLVGNLKAFLNQEFRCKNCGARYRRIPLSGKCRRCGGELTLTVFEGAVVKYLSTAINLIKSYPVSTYLEQNVKLVKKEMESLFKKLEGEVVLDQYL